MAVDRKIIGVRIRKIREEPFNETRDKFGKRCNLSEKHIGHIERGEFLISLKALDCISSAIGDEDNKLHIKKI